MGIDFPQQAPVTGPVTSRVSPAAGRQDSAPEAGALFNPFDPAARTDPYPGYRRLSETEPVHRPFPGVTVLSRHRDVGALLRNPAVSTDRRKSPMYEAFLQSLPEDLREEQLEPSMLFLDPPDHNRLRALVSRAFTARVVADLQGRIAEIVEDLLTAVSEKGQMDLIADLAYPLPVTVISDMLGVPATDRAEIRHWSLELIPTLDPMIPPDTLRRAQVAAGEFRDYMRAELIPARRRDPGNDLLSRLIVAEDEGEQLSEDELVSTCVLLLIAGHETTSGLIGNGTLALLRDPDQLRLLRENPQLDRTAVEELLRYDSPVQMTARLMLDDTEIAGEIVPAGEEVVGLLGAANRDPDAFEDPDRLNLARSPNRHIAFGTGIHFCLGAPLARAEAGHAIPELVRRFPRLELAGEPRWRETITLRGLTSLPVAV